MNVRIVFPSGETIFFSVSFAILWHGFILEIQADSLEKEMKIEERKKSIVCAREHTIYFFMLISEKLADFIIAVTGKCIECELRGVGTRSLLRV